MDRAKENQRAHLRRLVRNGGFQFTDTFFPYTSGEIGPYYVQSAAILKNGDDYYRACHDMEGLVRRVCGKNIDVISGGETRDWMFSFPVASVLHTPHVMIYKNGKILGASILGEKVAHVADLNNEGSSPRDYWVPAIKNGGGDIDQIFFYVDRMEDGVEEMRKLGLDSCSLVPLDETAWDILLNDNVITKNVYENLRRRMEDKEEWAMDILRSKKGIETLAKLERDPLTKNKAEKIMDVGYPDMREELLHEVSLINGGFGPGLR